MTIAGDPGKIDFGGQVEVRPLRDVWVLGWFYPDGSLEPQSPSFLIRAGERFSIRGAVLPTSALVDVCGRNGGPAVLPLER